MRPRSRRYKKVFVSYRRKDSGGHAGCLAADLGQSLGVGAAVFRDVNDIQPGEQFPRAITDELGRCAVVLVVIGPLIG